MRVDLVLAYNSPEDYVMPRFKAKEIACKCCGNIKISYALIVELPALRQAWGRPLNLNSVCRCPTHNVNEKGHKRSLHKTENDYWNTATCGFDIDVEGWPDKDKRELLRLLDSRGLSTGLSENFIHGDLRTVVLGLKQTRFFYGSPPGWYQ